jgi:hypothetical protein
VQDLERSILGDYLPEEFEKQFSIFVALYRVLLARSFRETTF